MGMSHSDKTNIARHLWKRKGFDEKSDNKIMSHNIKPSKTAGSEGVIFLKLIFGVSRSINVIIVQNTPLLDISLHFSLFYFT